MRALDVAYTSHARTTVLPLAGARRGWAARELALRDRPAATDDRARGGGGLGCARSRRRRVRVAVRASLPELELAEPRSAPTGTRAVCRLLDGNRSRPAAAAEWRAAGAVDGNRADTRHRARRAPLHRRRANRHVGAALPDCRGRARGWW